GAGKTTALLALTRGLLRHAQVDFSEPVPVVLSLATFDPSRPFTVWLAAELHTKYGVPTRWAERWLAERALVLMLDGLDEVVAARQGECIAAIDALLCAGGAGCVVSCRELAYAELQQRPRVGAVIRVAPVREALVQ